MAITSIPAFTKVPNRADPPEEFSADVDQFLTDLASRLAAANVQAGEVNQLAAQIAAQAQAVAQGKAEFDEGYAAFLAALGAEEWEPGAHAKGVVVWSPTDGLPYRAKDDLDTATDPAADPASWYDLFGTFRAEIAALQAASDARATEIEADARHFALTFGA